MKYSLLVKQGAHLTHINSMKPHNSVKQKIFKNSMYVHFTGLLIILHLELLVTKYSFTL